MPLATSSSLLPGRSFTARRTASTACRVVGSPEQVAEYYQALVDAGMGYFVVQTLDATDTESIELLAREVIPAVRRRASS